MNESDDHKTIVRQIRIGHGHSAFESVCTCEAWIGPLRQDEQDAARDGAAHEEEARDV